MKNIRIILFTVIAFLVGTLSVNAQETCGVFLAGITDSDHRFPRLDMNHNGAGDVIRIYYGSDKEELESKIDEMREAKEYITADASRSGLFTIDDDVLRKNYISNRTLYVYVEVYEIAGYFCQSDIIDISLPKLDTGKRFSTIGTPGKLNVSYNEVIREVIKEVIYDGDDWISTFLSIVKIHKIDDAKADQVKSSGLVSLIEPVEGSLVNPTKLMEGLKESVDVDISSIQLEKGGYYAGNFTVTYEDELAGETVGSVMDAMLYQAVENEDGELYLVDYNDEKFAYPSDLVEDKNDTIIENPKTGPLQYVQIGLLMISMICIGGMVFLKRTEKDKVLSFKKI